MKHLLFILAVILIGCNKQTVQPTPQPQSIQIQAVEDTVYFEFSPTGNLNSGYLRIDWDGDNTTDSTIIFTTTKQPEAVQITKRTTSQYFKAQWNVKMAGNSWVNYSYQVNHEVGKSYSNNNFIYDFELKVN